MDRIGLQELIRAGVNSARTRLQQHRSDSSLGSVQEDPQFVLVLDRLTQLGTLLLEHDVDDSWENLVNGILEIYRTVLPARDDYDTISRDEAHVLVILIQRVFVLGAFAVKRERYEFLRMLVLQKPDGDDGYYYWVRHAVTMAARAEVQGAFRGNSLIGPASEMVRTKSEFFVLFDQNMDQVVDSMCQFDFLQCLFVLQKTKDVDNCYPNFGGYWNHRTLPIVRDVAKGRRVREALNEISDADLARFLSELDRHASRAFFRVNGWRANSWHYPEIEAFIKKNDPHSER